jgi:hypothetical protein
MGGVPVQAAGEQSPLKTYQNILVYAMVNLGDVILTTSAIALLKQVYPAARITMLSRPTVREVIEHNPVIDDVILFDYKAKKNALGQMWAMVRELRARRFDLAISFDRKLRPALLCFLAGIPVRVGPSRVFDARPSRVTWLYTHTVSITHDLDDTLQAETYQEIIRGFTGTDGHARPILPAPDAAQSAKAAEMLAPAEHMGKKKIGLCVKGTFALKTWPKEYFAAVVRALSARYDAAFYVTGAPGDYEYAQEVIACMGVPAENLCGKTNLMELAALYARLDLLLSVDTGGGHIAAAVGAPLVTIFGCTSPRRWHPISSAATALTSHEPCCPCSYRETECPSYPRPNCLYHVLPEEALRACIACLDGAVSVQNT